MGGNFVASIVELLGANIGSEDIAIAINFGLLCDGGSISEIVAFRAQSFNRGTTGFDCEHDYEH